LQIIALVEVDQPAVRDGDAMVVTSCGDTGCAVRISLRPHDPYTGAELDGEEMVKGYE
jgi:hypothetical protein